MKDELENNYDNKRLEIILNNDNNENLRIGDKAPLFNADTTFGNIKLSDYEGKWLILFSHPGDFTPVCTTEFLAFAKMYPEFKKRNCELLGLSIDSTPSHLAWINNIYKNTGIQIPFPIIADRNMQIAKKYSMIAPNVSTTQTVRTVFFICPNQTIRAILQYPMTNGRNIAEILRLLDAMQFTDEKNIMTPANWLPNQPGIMPMPKTYKELMEKQSNLTGFNCIDWYLCFNTNIPNDIIEKNSSLDNRYHNFVDSNNISPNKNYIDF